MFSKLSATLADAFSVYDATLQQTEPSPQAVGGGGGAKKDTQRQRKERQQQRKVKEAIAALRSAMEAMADPGQRCVLSHVAPLNMRHSTPDVQACLTVCGVCGRGCWAARARR